jgi:hypothetical protein
MTEKYFISTNPRISGSHTVHRQGCPFLPVPGIRILLGVFPSPWEALKEGRRYFRRADSCPFCLKEHNRIKKPVFTEINTDPDLISLIRMKKVPWESLMFFSVS